MDRPSFTAIKVKTSLYVKIVRNWWNFNAMKANFIPLSGVSMG